ncbi:MAG: hypothetical protein V2I26_01275 [Halieaceae bacterium]|jgi:hypothetical protein|nr:hypothetical protein [Halieaceae bacterium]
MTSKHNYRKTLLMLLLIAMPLLVGSQCAVFFSSGSGSNDDDDDKDEELIVVATGRLGTAPVSGASYISGSVSGVTGSNGEFEYEVGKPVRFSIGDIPLGRAVSGKSIITVQDLAAGSETAATVAINIERLMQSLDAEQGDDAITIPARVLSKAVRSNETVTAAITYLDFADDTAFANAASQLVSVLTHDYPFTGSLVDAETARRSLARPM